MDKAEDKLAELRRLIKIELEMCDSSNVPTVCQMKNTPEGYKKIEQLIINSVMKTGDSIGEAILRIEKEYNPNEHVD